MPPQKRNYAELENYDEEPVSKRRRIDDKYLIRKIEEAFAEKTNFLLFNTLHEQLKSQPTLSIDISVCLLSRLTAYIKSGIERGLFTQTPPNHIFGPLAEICLTAIEDITAFEDWIQKSSYENVALFIYNYGYLASCSQNTYGKTTSPPFFPDFPSLPTTHLKIVLKKEILNVNSLSILMKSVGWLAREKKLNGMLSIETFIPVLTIFRNSLEEENVEEGELNEIDETLRVTICNTFYALGLMAKSELLKNKINCKLLKMPLDRSENFQWDSFTLSRCFLTLSTLAQQNLLEGSFDASLFAQLTRKLGAHPPSISNCMHGLGLLASKKLLAGTLDAAIIDELLKKFIAPVHKSILNIENCWQGLKFLIAEEKIAGQINTEVLNSFLECRDRALLNQVPVRTNEPGSTSTPRVESNNSEDKTTTTLETPADLSTPPQPLPRSQSFAGVTTPRQPRPLQRSLPSMRPLRQRIDNALFEAIEARDVKRLETLLGCVMRDLSGPAKIAAKGNAKRTNARHQNAGGADRADNKERANNLITIFFNHIPQAELQELCSNSKAAHFSHLLDAGSRNNRYELAKAGKFAPILLGLSIGELKYFINALIHLELYRAHEALLEVIKTLHIRYKTNLNEAQDIFDLIQQIINAGLEFHKKSDHFNVVSLLYGSRRKISRPVPPLPVSSVREEPAPTPIIPPAPPQPVQMPVIITPPFRINNKYQYEDTDINTILTARVREFNNVHVLASANMNADENCNRIVDVLNSFLEQATNDSQHLLLPIHIGGHWIGIRIQLDKKKIQKITYYNSLQSPNDNYATTIKNQLWAAGLIEGELQIQEPHITMQQSDGTSCGPILIENFYCDLRKKWWQEDPMLSRTQIQDIRRKHLQILQDRNPEYYRSFNLRQANNISSVTSQTLQRQVHGFYATGSTSSTHDRQDTPEPRKR